MTATTHADWARNAYTERVIGVADRLRQMADDVDRHAAGLSLGRAEHVVHTVLWGVANLNLDGVVVAERELADALLEEARNA